MSANCCGAAGCELYAAFTALSKVGLSQIGSAEMAQGRLLGCGLTLGIEANNRPAAIATSQEKSHLAKLAGMDPVQGSCLDFRRIAEEAVVRVVESAIGESKSLHTGLLLCYRCP